MTRKKEPTEAQLEWLEQAVERGVTFKVMAAEIEVCVDTLKRILHRHGIMEFDGAQYQIRPDYIMWERPCMGCGDKTPRPKNLFFCHGCRPSDGGVPDEWNEI